MNILLGLTGSVATTISAKLIDELKKFGDVKVVCTDSSVNFKTSLNMKNPLTPWFTDDYEWKTYYNKDTVFHIDIRKWADVFVIAPLSANTLGKISNGICDNLLTCVAQAWDFSKPIVIAPAMNTHMFTNPTTQKNLKTLTDMGYVVVPPIRKVLACGDDGIGAMAHINDIVKTVVEVSTPWSLPILIPPGIPVADHPGSFGVKRKHDFHTGIDLYCSEGDTVYSCTDGVVVEIKPFTGPSIGHTWWNETKAIVVDTGRNYILYGELEPTVYVGQKVKQKEPIGKIVPVLPENKHRPDIPGHSVNMLHLELLRRNPVFTEFQGRNGFMTWDLDKCQPYDLFDPTPNLLKCKCCPKQLDYLK